MENHNNEQRLRILQERLGQIKNKQETQSEQPKVENTAPYPTYNPKATQSSDEDIVLEQKATDKQPSSSSWKKVFTLLIILGLGYCGFYLYESLDINSLLPKTNDVEERIVAQEEKTVPLQYSLYFGEAKYLILLASFDSEEAAKTFSEEKVSDGYEANYFFLPEMSNSNDNIYQVYLGPYFSEAEAKQWANSLDSEFELLNL